MSLLPGMPARVTRRDSLSIWVGQLSYRLLTIEREWVVPRSSLNIWKWH